MRRKRNKTYIIIIFISMILLISFSIGYSLLSQNLNIEGKGNINVEIINDFEVTFERHWGEGNIYNLSLSLKNLTNTSSNGWKIIIKIPSDLVVTSAWGCNYKIENNQLIISDAGWNGIIAGNGSQNSLAGINITTNDPSFWPIKYQAIKS